MLGGSSSSYAEGGGGTLEYRVQRFPVQHTYERDHTHAYTHTHTHKHTS